MSMKLNKKAYQQLIDEDVNWLKIETTDCLEQNHILQVLKDSVRCYYGQEWQIDQLQAEVEETEEALVDLTKLFALKVAEIEKLKAFQDMANKMYPKRMLIVDGAVDFIREQALKKAGK